MIANSPDIDQLAMFEMPPVEPTARPVRARKAPVSKVAAPEAQSVSAAADVNTPLGSLTTLFQVFPDVTPGVVLVDPRAVVVDPINVHHDVPFEPETHRELIIGMQAIGNTAPVRLRPDPAGGPGYSCVSGARRLGSALHIQATSPGFRLRAIIEEMTDEQASAIAEGDNAGRTGISALRQARKWAENIARIYGGDRGKFLEATGTGSSVLSRTLSLLSLPDYVLACCADIYALNPYFAEQLVPRLGDPAEEPQIRKRAEALVTANRRLAPAALITALVKTPATLSGSSNALWTSADGKGSLSLKPGGRKGDRIEVAGIQTLSASERRDLLKALDTHLKGVGR